MRTPVRVMSRLAVLLFLAGSPAQAETPPAPNATEEAKALFRRGAAHYVAGAYDLAAEEYEAAYARMPLPAILFNLGQAHRQLGHRTVALDYYRRYLAAQPDGPGGAEARGYVEQLGREEEAERALAAAKASATPAPPPLETAPPSPAPTAAPGPEAVAPSSSPASPADAPVVAAPAASPVVSAPKAAAAIPPPAAVTPSPPSTSPTPAAAPSRSRRALVWGLVGAGAAMVAAGVVVGAAFGARPRDPQPNAGVIRF